jgi:hypothetical protein
LVCTVIWSSSLWGADARPAGVAARFREGSVHGFLVLSTLDGTPLADGDLTQSLRGDRVTSHLVYHFKDGSLHDETAVFTDRGDFRLLSYHLSQEGATFPHPMEVWIDTAKSQVRVRSSEDEEKGEGKDDKGQKKVTDKVEHVELSPDVSNGLVLILLKNIRPEATETKVSMVAATPKPRVVKLAITAQGEDHFLIAGSRRKATQYVVKVEIPGAAGVVADVLGKKPPDTHVWILQGDAPAFVKSEGPLFFGGPMWRTELTIPVWPESQATNSK